MALALPRRGRGGASWSSRTEQSGRRSPPSVFSGERGSPLRHGAAVGRRRTSKAPLRCAALAARLPSPSPAPGASGEAAAVVQHPETPPPVDPDEDVHPLAWAWRATFESSSRSVTTRSSPSWGPGPSCRRAGEVDERLGPKCRRHLVDDLEQAGPQAWAGRTGRGAEGEDRRADLADGGVEVLHRGLDPTRDRRLGGQPLGGLERHARGEEALDDRVVEVHRDALSVLQQRQLADPGVQPGVLDGHAGRRGERNRELLVDVGEDFGGLLVGEVEVAEDLAPNHDRDAQERVHLGVVRGKPEAVGVLVEIGQAQRPWVGDEHAEDAMPLGQLADGSPRVSSSIPTVMNWLRAVRSTFSTPSAP